MAVGSVGRGRGGCSQGRGGGRVKVGIGGRAGEVEKQGHLPAWVNPMNKPTDTLGALETR